MCKMPLAGGPRAFNPSLEDGQATLIFTSVGIAQPRRPYPGSTARSVERRENASMRYMTEGPNKQRVIAHFTSYRS